MLYFLKDNLTLIFYILTDIFNALKKTYEKQLPIKTAKLKLICQFIIFCIEIKRYLTFPLVVCMKVIILIFNQF